MRLSMVPNVQQKLSFLMACLNRHSNPDSCDSGQGQLQEVAVLAQVN